MASACRLNFYRPVLRVMYAYPTIAYPISSSFAGDHGVSSKIASGRLKSKVDHSGQLVPGDRCLTRPYPDCTHEAGISTCAGPRPGPRGLLIRNAGDCLAKVAQVVVSRAALVPHSCSGAFGW
jgi:hypothetical protein